MAHSASRLVIILLVMMICLPTWVCKAQVGRFSPIEDLTDPRVTTAAQYAVYRHDIDTGSRLRLIDVVNGEVQYVVGGANYRLIIFAHDGVQINSYEADVYVPLPRVNAPFRLTGFLQIS
ncbi:hypothetical protein QQ045_005228 [Rhodiola kirilowii]